MLFKIIVILAPALLNAGAQKVPALQPAAQLAQCIQSAKKEALVRVVSGNGKMVAQLTAEDLKKCSASLPKAK